MSDLPSTFDSLIVQHQSNIVRLALLLRYGGIYMDVSTINCSQGIDEIWNATLSENLMLTTLVPFSNGMSMANNAFLIVPGRKNRILSKWQRRILGYFEAPVTTVEEMRMHPTFQRVAPFFDDPALGILKDVIPYCSILWILMDVLYFDENLRPFIAENVLALPVRRWTFDTLSLPVLGTKSSDDPANDPPIASWKKSSLIPSMWYQTLVRLFDEPTRAEHLTKQVNVFKASSASLDFYRPINHHLELESTLGRVYRVAIKEGPSIQDTLEGAMPILTTIDDE